jgi:RNA polymerase sigma-70 factor (ECF subfamily)
VELPDPLSACSDEELLSRFCRGKTEAFGLLVRRYERELYGYLRRYLGDSSLAEDVFQNTFLQLYLKSGQYEAGRPVRPWLYTIATHQAIDALRRNARHQILSLEQKREDRADGELHNLLDALESRGPAPLDNITAQERKERVRASVERLPDFFARGGDPGLLPGFEIPRDREDPGYPRWHGEITLARRPAEATGCVERIALFI